MEKTYWIGRKRAAMAMARSAASSRARLIHYELAGRYSIRAAHCLPFPVAPTPPATEGARLTLHLPERRDPPPPGGEGR
jgi:hypothetical protein